jgi:hypothetical protein
MMAVCAGERGGDYSNTTGAAIRQLKFEKASWSSEH